MSTFGGPQGSPAAASGYPKAYVTGLGLRYSSATAVIVETGSCRDKDNAADVDLDTETTVAITTLNAAAGLERKTLTATAARTSGSASVTFSANIASEFTSRALTGTWSGASTTLTGTSTLALSQLAVGDLVGSSTTGWSRVTAIASDTSITIAAALPTAAASGSTLNVLVENVLATAIAATTKTLDTLTGNGLTGVYASTWGSTDSGQAVTFGDEVASAWYAVWVASGGSGTTAFLSSQRTKPFLSITGYTTRYRRVGWARNDAAGAIEPFSSSPAGWILREVAGDNIVSGGGATSWTAVDCSSAAPPTARLLLVTIQVYNPASATRKISVRARNAGASDTSRNNQATTLIVGDVTVNTVQCACDGAQNLDYALNAADANNPAYVGVAGYYDSR